MTSDGTRHFEGAAVLSVGILGSLRVIRGDVEVPVASRMQRRLLTALAINAGTVIPRDRLVNMLWDGAVPVSAAKTLQAHVARLRRTLSSPPGQPRWILTRPPGYLLATNAVEIDAGLLEQHVREAASVRAEHPERAAMLLEAALRLSRGPALAEFRDEDFAGTAAQRLDELVVTAREDLAEILLALGRYPDGLGIAQAIIADHPHRERPVALAIEALSRLGRQTEALRAYESFAQRLASEPGRGPSAKLQAVAAKLHPAAPPPRARPVGSGPEDSAGSSEGPSPLWSAVTRREREVLDAVAAQLTNAEIAERLFISVRTVESHVSALLRKLGATDRKELAGLVAKHQPVEPPAPALPSAVLTAVATGTFTGRSEERAAVEAAFHASIDTGRRLAVVVSGQSGIGKTRLVAEAAVALQTMAATISCGRCDEEALVPYQPLAEWVASLAAVAPPDVVETVAPTLARAVPALADLPVARSRDHAPEPARAELFAAFDAFFSVLPQPVLLIVDDLQWADRPTLQAIRYMLRSARQSPILVAATVRSESLVPGSDLADVLTTLEAEERVTTIHLAGLSSEQVESMVACDFPRSAALAERAWLRTGGNPFLLRELLRHLDETGAETLDAVPTGLRELVARRIAHLQPELVEVLTAGALMGEIFRLGIAARAIDKTPVLMFDAIETALRAGLVVEVPGAADSYRFAHALVRDALVQRLASSRRLHLHLQLASELEAAGGRHRHAEVAHHLYSALPESDPNRLIENARQAASHAMDQLAYEHAAELQTMVLDALRAADAPEADVAVALLARGDARLRAGDSAAARQDLVEAARLAAGNGDGVLLARAALGVGEAASIWGADAELAALLEQARAALGDGSMALRARVTARLAQALYYTADTGRRRQLSSLAEADATAAGDDEALAWVLSARHAALWGPEDTHNRIETAQRIHDMGERMGQPELLLRSQALLVVDLLEGGDVDGARRATRRHAELAHDLRQRIHLRDVEVWAATWAMLEGRLDAAERAILEARALSEAAQDPNADLIYWVQWFWLVIERGIPSELDEMVNEYERLAVENPHVPAWRASLAYLHIRRDDPNGVELEYSSLARHDFADVPRDLVWFNAIAYIAEACAYLGDQARAKLLLDTLTPFSDRIVLVDRAMICKGAMSRYLGLLAATAGRPGDADRWLRAALDRHEAMGAVPLADRTRRDLDQVQAI